MRVLVIDDDATFRSLLNIHLTRQGHEVTVAEDGIQGQRMARQHLPDVIIIDYQMPAANGRVVAERITRSSDTQHIPMILVSGASADEIQNNVSQTGVVETLSKLTLTEEELVRALENAVASKAVSSLDDRAALFPGE